MALLRRGRITAYSLLLIARGHHHAATAMSATPSSKPNMRVVLIHGLDSSKETWNNVLPKLQQRDDCTVTAIDCRGCGRHPLDLKDEEFSVHALVEDVNEHLKEQTAIIQPNNDDEEDGNRNLVLLGHSMGARIALAYAATYPERIACLIMEDMDIGRRRISEAPFVVSKLGGAPFSRQFASQEDAREALSRSGYPQDRIDRWIQEQRIFPLQQEDNSEDNVSWWSLVNPDFRRLCYEKVVDNDSGVAQCQTLAASSSHKFPIHVLVGGPEGTICRSKSLAEMVSILGEKRVTIHDDFPPDASHSIHSSHLDKYMAKINSILQ